MALEIVQSWAEWYPIDYFNDEKSRYKQYYDKLKSDKVTFPNIKEQ